MNISVVLAGGNGKRMKLERGSKQLLKLNGKPVFLHSVDVFQETGIFDKTVVVYNPDYRDEYIKYLKDYKDILMVEAGHERWRSSLNALEEIERSFPLTNIVAIHDGARPFIRKELIENMVKDVKKDLGVIPGVYLKDTIKKINKDNIVVDTPKRSKHVKVMTPQVFDFKNLLEAYRSFDHSINMPTDDAMIFESYGKKVKVVIADESNIKITTPEDIIVARKFMSSLFC